MAYLRAHSFLRAPTLHAAALAVAALCPACGGQSPGPYLSHVEVLVGADESLQILSRARTGEDEGGHFLYYEFLYTAQDGDEWRLASSPLGKAEGSSGFEEPYRLLTDSQGRTFLAAEVGAGLVVQVLDGPEWRTLAPSPTLPDAARDALGQDDQFGAAWIGTDDVLRVLYGAWLFEVDNDQIARAIDARAPCPLEGGCIFDPTGDQQGDAAIYDPYIGKYTLRTLECPSGECAWTDVPGVDLGTSDDGGDSGPFRRIFFHTADGEPMLVRPVNPASGEPYAVLASTTDHETTVVSENVYILGAAPRPGGGLAVAIHTYDDQLRLVVADAGDQRTTFDLGPFGGWSEPIAVNVVMGSSGKERAHVVLPEAGTAVAHFTVELPGGEVTREQIQLR